MVHCSAVLTSVMSRFHYSYNSRTICMQEADLSIFIISLFIHYHASPFPIIVNEVCSIKGLPCYLTSKRNSYCTLSWYIGIILNTYFQRLQIKLPQAVPLNNEHGENTVLARTRKLNLKYQKRFYPNFTSQHNSSNLNII